MKLKLLLSGLLLCVFSVSAQDVITMTDGSSIKAKVEEITDSAVKYRKHTNPAGPIYTISLDAVSKIVYSNGETDLFNAAAETPTAGPADTSADVEESQQSATQLQTQLNEAELLRMAEIAEFSDASLKHYKKAKTYKRIAWIGGGVLVAAGGIIAGVIIDADYDTYYLPVVALPIAVGGVAWCVTWNVAANNQMKKARLAEAYSVPVIESEMLRIGKTSLMGSINVMGDNFTRSRALGLGLSFQF